MVEIWLSLTYEQNISTLPLPGDPTVQICKPVVNNLPQEWRGDIGPLCQLNTYVHLGDLGESEILLRSHKRSEPPEGGAR